MLPTGGWAPGHRETREEKKRTQKSTEMKRFSGQKKNDIAKVVSVVYFLSWSALLSLKSSVMGKVYPLFLSLAPLFRKRVQNRSVLVHGPLWCHKGHIYPSWVSDTSSQAFETDAFVSCTVKAVVHARCQTTVGVFLFCFFNTSQQFSFISTHVVVHTHGTLFQLTLICTKARSTVSK